MHAFLLLAALCAEPDIEAMKLSLQSRIAAFEALNGTRKGGDPIVVTPHEADSGVVKHEASSDPAPVPKTAVCQCQGSKRGVCFCLQNGVACRCHASKGSVWNLNEQGRAVSKTGQYADPRGKSAIALRDVPAGSAPVKAPRQVQTPARSAAPAARAPLPMIRIPLPTMQSNCPNCRRQQYWDNDD